MEKYQGQEIAHDLQVARAQAGDYGGPEAEYHRIRYGAIEDGILKLAQAVDDLWDEIREIRGAGESPGGRPRA